MKLGQEVIFKEGWRIKADWRRGVHLEYGDTDCKFCRILTKDTSKIVIVEKKFVRKAD